MKASLRSVRIAPKKANIIARMVRGLPALEAIALLENTHKKAARLVEELLRSAVANATHNEKQDASQLVVRTIVVNQAAGYRRGVPMARGRVRPMIKFMSHIDVVLGIEAEREQDVKAADAAAKTKKSTKKASSSAKAPVEKKPRAKKHTPATSPSSEDNA